MSLVMNQDLKQDVRISEREYRHVSVYDGLGSALTRQIQFTNA